MHDISRSKLVWGLALVLLLASGTAVYSTFINTRPHLFSATECFECHFTVPDVGGQRPYRFTKPISGLCGRCHGGLSPLSHVVGVVPSMKMPEGMPLDALGMMTCATCHDPHRNQIDSKTGRKTYYLRVEFTGQRFCLLCHESRKVPGQLSIYARGGGLTHRRSMTRSHGFTNFSVVDPSVAIDPLSLMCMGCHGEGEEEADREKLGKGIWVHGGGIGMSHPVGVDYEDAAWRNEEFVSPKYLDPRITLFDRKVGCCTCHDPYKMGGGDSLVISEGGSYQKLCQACHNY